MRESVEKTSIRYSIRTWLIIVSIVIIRQGFIVDARWYIALLITIPAILIASFKRPHKRSTLRSIHQQDRKSASIS